MFFAISAVKLLPSAVPVNRPNACVMLILSENTFDRMHGIYRIRLHLVDHVNPVKKYFGHDEQDLQDVFILSIMLILSKNICL